MLFSVNIPNDKEREKANMRTQAKPLKPLNAYQMSFICVIDFSTLIT